MTMKGGNERHKDTYERTNLRTLKVVGGDRECRCMRASATPLALNETVRGTVLNAFRTYVCGNGLLEHVQHLPSLTRLDCKLLTLNVRRLRVATGVPPIY